MKFKTKRRWSFLVTAIFAFTGGCEFGVVLPTIWDYLQSLGATNSNWLGFSIAGFSVVGAVAGIIGGRLSDKHFNRTKRIALISMGVRIWGSILYTFGYSYWNVLAARMFMGFGAMSGSVMIAETCRITAPKERTRILSVYNLLRQSGILFGPGFQLILSYANFAIFGFAITPLNAPGALLTVLCLIAAILCSVFFNNLVDEFNEIRRNELEESLENQLHVSKNGTRHSKEPSKETRSNFKILYQSMFPVFMFTSFTALFCQVNTESMVPVIMEDTFGLSSLENSLVYMSGGVAALIVFAAVACLSKYVRDTTFLIIGFTLMLIGQLILLIFLSRISRGSSFDLVAYLSGVVLQNFGYPLSVASNAGLFSKYLTDGTQGVGQAMIKVSGFAALGVGPLWAGGTVKMPYLYMSVPITLMLLNLVAFAANFKEVRRMEENNSNEAKETGEAQLLIDRKH